MGKIFEIIIIYQLDIVDKKTYDKLCHVGSHFVFCMVWLNSTNSLLTIDTPTFEFSCDMN